MKGLRTRWLLLSLLLFIALVACDSESADLPDNELPCPASNQACDPLTDRATETTVEPVLAVGEADDGTLYVLSGGDYLAEEKVFVSAGDVLIRKEVLGMGIMGQADGGERYAVTFLDAEIDRKLIVVLSAEDVESMKVCEGDEVFMSKGEDPPEELCEQLTLVGKEVLSGYQTESLPGTMLVEYNVEVADGTWIIVVVPEHDWGYEDFRLFWGPPGDLVEQQVLNVVRFSDGGTTDITFKGCQGIGFVHLNNSLTGYDGIDWSGSFLHLGGEGGEDIDVTRLGSDTYDPTGKTYHCLEASSN